MEIFVNYRQISVKIHISLTIFRMGVATKVPSTSFSHRISTNVGIYPQNFLTLIFNPFFTLVKIFKAIPSLGPKLLALNQGRS